MTHKKWWSFSMQRRKGARARRFTEHGCDAQFRAVLPVKWLKISDVTGCCRCVADVLPVKLLMMSRVADVADFPTSI